MKDYQVGDEIEPLPETLQDTPNQVGVVEEGKSDLESSHKLFLFVTDEGK